MNAIRWVDVILSGSAVTRSLGLGRSLPVGAGYLLARLTDRAELRPRPALTLDTATSADDWVVSRFGRIAAADVAIDGAVAAVLVYAAWENGRQPRL